jgi:hypothetical protein
VVKLLEYRMFGWRSRDSRMHVTIANGGTWLHGNPTKPSGFCRNYVYIFRKTMLRTIISYHAVILSYFGVRGKFLVKAPLGERLPLV